MQLFSTMQYIILYFLKILVSPPQYGYLASHFILQMVKKFLFIGLSVTLLWSCASKKGFRERGDAERSLQDAIRYLNRNPEDTAARRAIPVLYQQISLRHLDQIRVNRMNSQPEHWDQMIANYSRLQQAYDWIMQSSAAYKLITPVSYSTEIFSCKDSAAMQYYQLGEQMLDQRGRTSAQKAYQFFKKTNQYIPGYRDVQEKMQEAILKGTVQVVIMPIQDQQNSAPQTSNLFGQRNSNELFQQRLVNELESERSTPARFYTEKEARVKDLNADWIVNISLKGIQYGTPTERIEKRTVTKQTPIGTDSVGQTVYKTLYAYIQTRRTEQKANGILQVNIMDVQTNREISSRTIQDNYEWTLLSSTFQGDRRALSPEDWEQINNSQNKPPRREEILSELYKKFFPTVTQEIRRGCGWNY